MTLTIDKASSSNSSTSNSTQKWNFHVFISFRGEDTRKSFTDHLYAAICRKGIKAFKDDEALRRGEVIKLELLQAIESSLFAIVVLSKNYASSTWCLDELQKIVESRNELGQQVLPIFYGVDPSDVRHQKASFAEAFTVHEEKFKEEQEKVWKWRDSLTKVANLSGWDAKDWHEAELIENVVEVLWSKLHSKLPSNDGMLIGIDQRLDVIYSLLQVGLDDVRFVGIWGTGGIGKTTLASVAYERLQNHFEICCFLRNVREVSERDDGEVHLQTELLSHLKVKGMVIDNTYQGKNTIRNLFSNKRILLVLDDVSLINQLMNLAGSQEWFSAGSRVIITTRDMHLLISHGVHEIYKVESMNKEESFQLFSQNAFRRDQPKEGYLELSESVVNYAGGLPLALCVLGSFLCGRNLSQWKDALDKLKKVPNNDILKKLRISYDALDEEEKTIFLDIACFFKGWDKNDVTQILKYCGLNATIGISILVERSLLNEGKQIEVHDLLVEMARSIVFQESPKNPGRRSRLWSSEDIHKVMNRNMGTEVIQGIVLCYNPCEAYWDPEAFSEMINVRLLIITCDFNLPRGLKCLSSALRVLQWNAFPLEYLPLRTQLDELVYLHMQHSKIKQLWDGKPCFENLKFMDLSHSHYLIKTPNFLGVPNLERLILEDCINLVEVHSSLGQLKNLLVVNLKGCRNLKVLPRKFEIDYLKEFVLCECIQVKKLPEFGENMKNMEVLNLRGCKNLVCLPHTIHNLKHLKILDISSCSKFSELPKDLNENEALEQLDASETAITEIPSSIGQLKKLKTLSFHGCKGSIYYSRWILPLSLKLNKIFQGYLFPKGLVVSPSIFNLKSLTKLDLSYCNIDEGFIPDNLGGLALLEELDLSGNQFVNLPFACISNLLQLRFLGLQFCPKLQSLPQPPPSLSHIDAQESASLETLCNQQLSFLFASIHLRVPPRTRFFEDDDVTTMLDLEAIIPGSEIPSWFKNQNHFTLDQNGKFSIITEAPPYKLLRFALCVALDEKIIHYETEKRIHGSWEVGYGAQGPDGNVKIKKSVGGFLVSKINSPHLWFLFGRIKIKNLAFTKDPSILRFSIFAHRRKKNNSDFPEIRFIKCGWLVMCQENLEEWESRLPILSKDTTDYPVEQLNRVMFMEASSSHSLQEESKSDSSTQFIIDRRCQGFTYYYSTLYSFLRTNRRQEINNEYGFTLSPEASSSYNLKEESKSDDSCTQFVTDDASMRNKGEEKRTSGLNFKRKGESVAVVYKFDEGPSSGPPKKKLKNGSPELPEEGSHHSEAHP